MMMVKLHDFLVVKTNDGEAVMKVREHCFAGVASDRPFSAGESDVVLRVNILSIAAATCFS